MSERSTRPFFTATPSARKRRACSLCCSDVGGNTIRPPAPSTRCHGRFIFFGDSLSARPASRARPGSPAARATPPYVDTVPRGIALTTPQISCMAGLSSGSGPRFDPDFLGFRGRNRSANDLLARFDISRLLDLCVDLRPGRCDFRKNSNSVGGLLRRGPAASVRGSR
jgi:hypothetical protein